MKVEKNLRGFAGISELVSDLDISNYKNATVRKDQVSVLDGSEKAIDETKDRTKQKSQVNTYSNGNSLEKVSDKPNNEFVIVFITLTCVIIFFFGLYIKSQQSEIKYSNTYSNTYGNKTDTSVSNQGATQFQKPRRIISPPSNSKTNNSIKSESQPQKLVYEKPLSSSTLPLRTPEIRWCLREQIRLTTIKNLVSSDEAKDEYNRLVDAYNSACYSRSYYKSDYTLAYDDIQSKRDEIIKESRKFIQGYNHLNSKDQDLSTRDNSYRTNKNKGSKLGIDYHINDDYHDIIITNDFAKVLINPSYNSRVIGVIKGDKAMVDWKTENYYYVTTNSGLKGYVSKNLVKYYINKNDIISPHGKVGIYNNRYYSKVIGYVNNRYVCILEKGPYYYYVECDNLKGYISSN